LWIAEGFSVFRLVGGRDKVKGKEEVKKVQLIFFICPQSLSGLFVFLWPLLAFLFASEGLIVVTVRGLPLG
jgi:hypothetical protein